MSPGQHFIISWVVANGAKLDRKSRICITLSGLLPDVDGIGYLVDKIGIRFGQYTSYYEDYHHMYGHNLLSGIVLATTFTYICDKRISVFFLSLLAFHLHLLCDLAGSMGPDGYQWPIPYLYPFLPDFLLTWSGQWELSSWQNSVTGILFFVIALVIARYRHVTFFELLSPGLEAAVSKVATDRSFYKFNKGIKH